MNRKIISAVTGIVFSTILVNADTISIKKCRELALKNSETVKIAKAELKQAENRKKEAATYNLPSLSASGLYFHQTTPDKIALGDDKMDLIPKSAYNTSLTLSQSIYSGGKISSGYKMAEIGKSIKSSGLSNSREDVIYEAEEAYWQHVSSIEKVKIARSYIQLLKELQATVKDSFDAGMVNRNDLLKIAVRYKRAELDLKKAENAREITRLNLCRITGLSNKTDIEVETLGKSPQPPAKILNLKPSPLLRSDYMMLQKQVHLKEEEINYNISDYMPQAGLSAALSATGLRSGGHWTNSTNAYAMVNVSIPVFNWNRKKYVRVGAEKAKEAQQETLNRASKLMVLEIRQSQLNLETAFKNLDLSHNYLVQAKENLALSEDNYKAGMEPLADLLEAQAEWQRAKGSVIDSEIECRIMIVTCKKSMGILLTHKN